MSSDVSCQCLSLVQCCFTSTETVRLIRTESPRRSPQLSHSSWTLTVMPFHRNSSLSKIFNTPVNVSIWHVQQAWHDPCLISVPGCAQHMGSVPKNCSSIYINFGMTNSGLIKSIAGQLPVPDMSSDIGTELAFISFSLAEWLPVHFKCLRLRTILMFRELWGTKSQDSAHRPQLLKRKESRSGIKPGSCYLPAQHLTASPSGLATF